MRKGVKRFKGENTGGKKTRRKLRKHTRKKARNQSKKTRIQRYKK